MPLTGGNPGQFTWQEVKPWTSGQAEWHFGFQTPGDNVTRTTLARVFSHTWTDLWTINKTVAMHGFKAAGTQEQSLTYSHCLFIRIIIDINFMSTYCCESYVVWQPQIYVIQMGSWFEEKKTLLILPRNWWCYFKGWVMSYMSEIHHHSHSCIWSFVWSLATAELLY